LIVQTTGMGKPVHPCAFSLVAVSPKDALSAAPRVE
jgi:hypothetical protein